MTTLTEALNADHHLPEHLAIQLILDDLYCTVQRHPKGTQHLGKLCCKAEPNGMGMVILERDPVLLVAALNRLAMEFLDWTEYDLIDNEHWFPGDRAWPPTEEEIRQSNRIHQQKGRE